MSKRLNFNYKTDEDTTFKSVYPTSLEVVEGEWCIIGYDFTEKEISKFKLKSVIEFY